ncbi:hypothetical protein NHX12_011118 [Muraenolepis orangiensis]|uniref:Spondin domain-containing protein n=1 Tax=Muraenolepis orangiensis TaxID=630683 RepID=A0A9Q0DH30_9TELE|nr:hypothetical protein NHX12_011118 [Muraenolepis orangiensis]
MTSSERHGRRAGWLRRLFLAVLLRLSACVASPPRPGPGGTDCAARGPASYILVFTGLWSPQTFPKQYPMFRPPAQWSKLIGGPGPGGPGPGGPGPRRPRAPAARPRRHAVDGRRAVTHNDHFRLWREGGAASAGVQSFAELGLTVELVREAKEARKRRAVGAMYRTAGIPNGISHSSTELLMQPRSPLVIPSPDWFVGVDSFSLCEGGQWKQEATLDLQPFDAGTDSGFTFSSPNFPTNPAENISRVSLSHAVGFTLAHTKHDRRSQVHSETPLDCEVSLWSSWGLCLGSCSRGGVRHRSRYILLRPANAGTPCPELEEQAECTHHSCLRRQ